MKILIPLIVFGNHGGFRTLSQLATHWINEGNDVDFIISIRQEPYYPTQARILLVNYKGDIVSSQCEKCYKNSFYRHIAITKFINKNCKKYDVILCSENITALLATLGTNKNIFYYIQAYEPEFFLRKSLTDFVKRTVAKMTYGLKTIHIVNADIYKDYKNLKAKYVIPPGLDLKIYYPKYDTWDGIRPFIIGCIGRVEEWKGSMDVAKAVTILQQKGANIKFKVAFNPVENNNYELVKPDGDENLSAYYRSLDILVAPGTLQLGAVHYPVIEAMASHTIVITTGYYPADESNSYIVPVHDPKKIADCIEYIMNNYNEAVIKSNFALQEVQRFDWNIVSKEFLNVFHTELNMFKERKN